MADQTHPALDAAVQNMLQRDLPSALINTRANEYGERTRFLKASTAITLANAIFGIGGWSTSVLDLQPVHNNLDQIIGYSATVRVTIHDNGASYEDVGASALESRSDDYPESPRISHLMATHEQARKGAVSDALKRCLRHLGPMMGNSLYEDRHERNRAAVAALERIEAETNRQESENRLFGTQYQHTSEIPLHLSVAVLLSHPETSQNHDQQSPEA